MFRLRILVPAAASLVAIAVAATGCAGRLALSGGGGPPGSAPASAAAAAAQKAPGPAKAGPLVTEPAAGFAVVYRMIARARRSIDLTMYELVDTRAEHGLAAAAERGVRVRVVLDRHEEEHNLAAYRYLRSHKVAVVWSSHRFRYTHQKTLVTDGSRALIMTANLTSRYYATSRDFLVADQRPADIAAISRVFNADFAHKQVRPGDGSDLVWSPTDSQRHLIALINGASHSLRIYFEEMADTAVENALIKAAKRGVSVLICGENEFGDYDSDLAKLARAGVRISYYSSSHGFYVHAKVVEADDGTRRAKVFIGSENFTDTSLNDNRELGIILTGRPVLASIARTFKADFAHGRHWR